MQQQELMVAGEAAVATQQPEPVDLLSVVARAAADPSVDVAKMQALLDMQERLMRNAAEVEFKAALARIQPIMPRVSKHGQIMHRAKDSSAYILQSKFAKYEDVDAAIRPLLAGEGFALDFDTEQVGTAVKVILRVSHRSGHQETRQITLPLDASGSKNSVQGVGSTMSYGKRYLVCGFFNIITVDQDDDANGGCISLDQQIVINDLIKETRADQNKFLTFMGCSSVDAIPASQYKKAVSALERKRK